MKVVALISGGKDSCYNMLQCVRHGHEVIALANLSPPPCGPEELDSHMYQTVGAEAVDLLAQCMDKPLFRRVLNGASVSTTLDYERTEGDEVEDLAQLLQEAKEKMPEIQGVSVGAILSTYQRTRVEDVCARLGLTSLAYLWQRDQEELLSEMLEAQVNAVVIKVAALGLKLTHLGMTLNELESHLLAMHKAYGLNVCGEGGEYETLVLDCPLFVRRLVIKESEIVTVSATPYEQTAYLRLTSLATESKSAVTLEAHRKIMEQRIAPISFDRPEDESLLAQLHALAKHPASSKNDSVTYSQSAFDDVRPDARVWANESVAVVEGLTVAHGEDESVREESRQAMEKLTGLLADMGTELQLAIKVFVILKNMADFPLVNEVYSTFFGPHPPARVCLASSTLPGQARLQLSCVALKPQCGLVKHTLHVQSVSQWAPANIGPYSQAVEAGDVIVVSGQIPLDAGHMTISTANPLAQCRLALSHCQAVLQSMGSGLDKALSLSCFASHSDIFDVAKLAISEANLKAPALYAAVSQLPRGAQLEWEVVADKEMETGQWHAVTRDHCVGTETVKGEALWHEERSVLPIKLWHKSTAKSLDPKKISLAIMNTCSSLLSACAADWSHVITMKWLHCNAVQGTALLAEAEKQLEHEVAMSCLPVASMADEVVVCVRLFAWRQNSAQHSNETR